MRRTALLAVALATWAVPGAASAQDPHIARLAQELRSPQPEVRRAAAAALGRASYAQSALLLGHALTDEGEAAIRLEIVRALRQIVFQRYPGYPEALASLTRAADDSLESDELVRLRAVEALWEAAKKDLLEPVPFLDRALGDASERLRLGAVSMLRKVGTPQAVEPLGRAALDVSQPQAVRLKAIEALGAVSLAEGGPAGRQVTRSNRRTAELLGVPPLAPASALEERHRRQVQLLGQVATDPATPVALALQAVKSLGRVKDKSAIPVLRQVVESHPSPAVRKQATGVLSHVLARQYE
ncbi:MAG: HEAT repeat domain-containing protein [Candidatus Latescibacterota bacterium]